MTGGSLSIGKGIASRVADVTASMFGHLEILVNKTGVIFDVPVMEMTEGDMG
jgi:hypothetical protein